MKLSNFFVAGLSAALFAAAAARVHGAAFVWDGGSLISDNWTDASNWNPNVVPDNNGTADLTFAGLVRPNPNVNVPFDVASVAFNSSAGAFTVGGMELTVRARGISNSDTQI